MNDSSHRLTLTRQTNKHKSNVSLLSGQVVRHLDTIFFYPNTIHQPQRVDSEHTESCQQDAARYRRKIQLYDIKLLH